MILFKLLEEKLFNKKCCYAYNFHLTLFQNVPLHLIHQLKLSYITHNNPKNYCVFHLHNRCLRCLFASWSILCLRSFAIVHMVTPCIYWLLRIWRRKMRNLEPNIILQFVCIVWSINYCATPKSSQLNKVTNKINCILELLISDDFVRVRKLRELTVELPIDTAYTCVLRR